MKYFEIWIGMYHLGQGYPPPTEPERVAVIKAPNFIHACALYELDKNSNLNDYDRSTNSNTWTGKYYESQSEALKSFKIFKM